MNDLWPVHTGHPPAPPVGEDANTEVRIANSVLAQVSQHTQGLDKMTESEMINSLEQHLKSYASSGIDVSSALQFFAVGEWLLAFEGLYIVSAKSGRTFAEAELSPLIEYFELSEKDLAELQVQ